MTASFDRKVYTAPTLESLSVSETHDIGVGVGVGGSVSISLGS